MNLATLRFQLLSLAENFKASKATYRYVAGALIFGHLLSYIGSILEFSSLTPSAVFNFQLWKLTLYSFIEPNIFVLLWSLLSVYQFFVLIEPVWRPIETLKYFVIVQLLAPFFIALIGIFSFAAFESLNFYFSGIICGYSSLCVAVLITIKQFLPDTVVLSTPFGRVKNNHLPGISVFISSILWLFGLVRGTVPLQIIFGIQISWTYLRYYQPHDDIEEIGDSSEHFAWFTLFPRRSQAFAAVIGKAAFRILAKVHICKRRRHVDLNQLPTVNVSMPGLENRDAERRRQKALRDLNERLSRAKKATSSPDFEMDDVPTGIIATSPVPASQKSEDSSRAMFYSGARDSESPEMNQSIA